MKLWINTLVWGRGYIENFLDYALPSLLAPGNLPALSRHVEAEFRIHTREEDFPQLLDGAAVRGLDKVVSTKFYAFQSYFSQPGCSVQSAARIPIVDAVREARGAVMFCSPDEIWADGSLDYIGQSLAAGNVAVMTPGYRVATETVVGELPANGRVSPAEMQRLLLRHAHPHVGAAHFRGPRCPAHPEYIVWPVGNEGVIFYHLIRSPDSPGVYVPHLVRLNAQGMFAEENRGLKFDLAPASRVLCASLTSINWMTNWLHDGSPHHWTRHAEFLHWYRSLDWDLMQPVRVKIVDNITPGLWIDAEQDAREYFGVVRAYRDQLDSGVAVAGTRPHSPSSCGSSLSVTDAEISLDVLRWTEDVIDGRFKQMTIDYLNRVAGDGW